MQHQRLSVYPFLDKGLQMQMQLQAQLLLIHCFSNHTWPSEAEGRFAAAADSAKIQEVAEILLLL